jgi:hypothetical protein
MRRDTNYGSCVRVRLARSRDSVLLWISDRLTILVVHLLDLEDIFPSAKVVMVEFIPSSDRCNLRAGELSKRREKEAVSDDNYRVGHAHDRCDDQIVSEQDTEHPRPQRHCGSLGQLVPASWV